MARKNVTTRHQHLKAVHKVLGEVVPLQQVTTGGGQLALRIRCANGEERMVLLQQEFWTTTTLSLLNIGSDPPMRTKKRKPATDESNQRDIAELETKPMEDLEAHEQQVT